MKFVPVITTWLPPDVGPEGGDNDVTVGTEAWYRNRSAATGVDVPSALETSTSTVPAAPAGAMAWICVGELTVNCATAAPNVTVVADVKFVPVISTTVPPEA